MAACAIVWVESHISQAACAYPITPSTPMGDGFAAEFANGGCNLWGERLEFLEPESEHSSVGVRGLRSGRKTSQSLDFIAFARTEARFARHFDSRGEPDQALRAAQLDRLENWRRLQELAGLR